MVATCGRNSHTRVRHVSSIVFASSGLARLLSAILRAFSATISTMRNLMPLILATTVWAQSGLRMQISHTTESLRGVSAVSRQVAWASGTHGTYLRTTDGGRTWIPRQVPDAATLDFRAVVAFSADEAFLMSAGAGEQSRVYRTSDAGQHWQLQFTNKNPKGFFDCMAFWDLSMASFSAIPLPTNQASSSSNSCSLTTDKPGTPSRPHNCHPQWRARVRSLRQIRASRSFQTLGGAMLLQRLAPNRTRSYPDSSTSTSGSPPEAPPPVSFTHPTPGKPGRSSTHPSLTAQSRLASSPSPSATRSTE